MSGKIVLSTDLELDALEAAAQRSAWVGTSGSGKTYGCGRYVEQAAACHIPVLILDTVSMWAPLRLAADGKRPGLPFVIIGGDHADVPLELGRGAELARFLIGQNASAVVDLSDYDPAERAPFVADLCERLLIELKHQKRRRPRFVVYDEAQDLAPQTPAKGEARMLKAVSALIRKGRNHLCGTVLLTQRPADVSKSALNLCGSLFVGGMFADHDRRAMRDWAGAKARSPLVAQQLKELPELQPGEFFFWSPSWMKRYERIVVLPKWTFDGSSSTPLPSDAELGKVAPVNVAALRTLLAPVPAPAAVPARGSKAARAAAVAPSTPPAAVSPNSVSPNSVSPNSVSPNSVPASSVFDAVQVAALQSQVSELERQRTELRSELAQSEQRQREAAEVVRHLAEREAFANDLHNSIQRAIDAYVEALRKGTPAPTPPLDPFVVQGPGIDRTGRVVPDATRGVPPAAPSSPPASPLGPVTPEYCQDLLEALVAYGPINRERLSLLSGKSRTSTTFANGLRRLIADGWVLELDGRFGATEKGRGQARNAPLPLGRALYDHYRGKLSPYDAETLDTVAKVRGGLTRQELAERSGHSLTSTTFAASVRTLKSMGLCEVVAGRVRLIDHVRVSLGLG